MPGYQPDGAEVLRQRADYTQKLNRLAGRHGWLRLTPAYSVKVVDEILAGQPAPLRVLDPFCGTATTALCAASAGHRATTLDVNRFLVWFGRVKTARYDADTLSHTAAAARLALERWPAGDLPLRPAPALHRIERWWAPATLQGLCRLRAAIEVVSEPDTQTRDLLQVAFCRTLIEVSNAAFDHQSMSFKAGQRAETALPTLAPGFARNLEVVLAGAAQPLEGSAIVLAGDARGLASLEGPFDLVVTSPPYANRMSYIRELRPYMYWLGFLTSGQQAGELDWQAIGGTWGSATSRLSSWRDDGTGFASAKLAAALHQIGSAENRNGALLARYVARYFRDIWCHLQGLGSVLSPGAPVHYIVGNSSFYGTLLSVEAVYAEMLASLGFRDVTIRPIRKRNSKRELVEFEVYATWPAGARV